MIKYRPYVLLILIIFSSCSLLRKPHINLPEKKATIKNVSVDSSSHALQKLLQQNLDFNTIQLKFKILYSDTNNSGQNVIANIRMKRDSVIWVSVTAPIGVEGVRMLITQDSVKILDRLEKTNYAFDFKYLYQFIPAGLTLHNLQDIIVGNAVFIDTTHASIRRSDSLYLLQTISGSLHTLAWCGPKSFTLFKYLLNDSSQHLLVFARYSDFAIVNNKRIPAIRSYLLKRGGRVQMDADLKEVKYNEPLSYPFKTKYK